MKSLEPSQDIGKNDLDIINSNECSVGTSVTRENVGVPDNNFTDLSSSVYNIGPRVKTVQVKVAELNFIIALDTILKSNGYREELYKLIHSNYGVLFSTSIVKEIRELSVEDLKDVCIYHYDRDTFSGIEYHILRHLMDSHLDMFEEDVRSGRINNLIKLCVSKKNLIVKVFPICARDTNTVSYMISLLYLVLLRLYKYQYPDGNICEIIKTLFTRVVPIVAKVVYTITINADDNYSWLKQLQQLESAYKFFDITNSKNQVKLVFRPRKHFLVSTLDFSVKHEATSDTNYVERFIKCRYELCKDGLLSCKTTIVGKEMVDSVFSTQIDEPNDPAPIYSRLSDVEDIYLAHYRILKTMLSFTAQHENQKTEIKNDAQELVESGKFRVISNISNTSKINVLTKVNTRHKAFKDIKMYPADDKILPIVKDELLKLGQKNNLVAYIIIIMELYNEDKSIIDATLDSLDIRTSDKIRKVISRLKKKTKGLASGYTLNQFYREH